jgi:D-3-phosphoglycerate dehydrogenase
MKILIADKLSEKAITLLKEIADEVIFNPELTAEDLPSNISNTEILVVRSTKVTKETIEAGKKLALIIRAGAGFNTIDVETASLRSIPVSNCPGRNSAAVAELIIGFMTTLDRRIIDATLDLREGNWKKKEYGGAKGLKSRVLGIIGTGYTAQALIKRAKALQMDVMAYSPSFNAEKAEELGVTYCPSLEMIEEQADVISINVAYNENTHHLINERFLSNIKDNVILINTSRGEIIDSVALKKAIKDKGLKVGLDVFENEPSVTDKLFKDKELASKIACTPHIGASTLQAAESIAAEVVKIVDTYKKTGQPIHCVNIRPRSEEGTSLIIRHINTVGVLAEVLHVLRDDGINVEEMENTIFRGGKAASCALKVDKEPAGDIIDKMLQSPNIITVDIKK